MPVRSSTVDLSSLQVHLGWGAHAQHSLCHHQPCSLIFSPSLMGHLCVSWEYPRGVSCLPSFYLQQMVQYSLMLSVIVWLKSSDLCTWKLYCFLFGGDKPRLTIAGPRTPCSLRIVVPAQLGGSVRDDEAQLQGWECWGEAVSAGTCGKWWSHHCKCSKNVWLWHLTTRFSVECDCVARLMAGFDHLQGLFQAW